MKRLTPIAVPPSHVDRYIAIRDSKKHNTRQALRTIHTQINAQFASYEKLSAANRLAELNAHPACAADRVALRACYDSPTEALAELKQAIKSSQDQRRLKICPMCETTLPKTFDHYAPAVRFPEFSVHGLNLIPCCGTCNEIKGDDWLTASGKRMYLYAYGDEVPRRRFLVARLRENAATAGVGVSFKLVRQSDMSARVWQLVKLHFKQLDLIQRYDELGNDEIAEMIEDCAIHVHAGGASGATFLRRIAAEREAVYGRTYWRSVLMRALAGHPRLGKWISRVR